MTVIQTENFDVNTILSLLPHRYPFLLVDKVLSYVPGESMVALKNVSFNEQFFNGHFPNKPVMPGVLMLEALAQTTGILAFMDTKSAPEADGLYFLAGIDNARFKQIVQPGDQLFLHTKATRVKRTISKFYCEAIVDGKVACSADITTVRRDSHSQSQSQAEIA